MFRVSLGILLGVWTCYIAQDLWKQLSICKGGLLDGLPLWISEYGARDECSFEENPKKKVSLGVFQIKVMFSRREQ